MSGGGIDASRVNRQRAGKATFHGAEPVSRRYTG